MATRRQGAAPRNTKRHHHHEETATPEVLKLQQPFPLGHLLKEIRENFQSSLGSTDDEQSAAGSLEEIWLAQYTKSPLLAEKIASSLEDGYTQMASEIRRRRELASKARAARSQAHLFRQEQLRLRVAELASRAQLRDSLNQRKLHQSWAKTDRRLQELLFECIGGRFLHGESQGRKSYR